MQNKKTSKYSKMIELLDEIEGKCVNNTELWVQSNRQTPPNQTLRLQLRPHFWSPSPSLSATHRPELHRLIFIAHSDGFYVVRTWVGRYRFRQEPTIEVLREKEKKKKKKRSRRALNVLEFGGMAGKKKEERRLKKKRVKVRVWRRKNRGKRRGKKNKEIPCVEDKKRGGKKEKKEEWNIITIFS